MEWTRKQPEKGYWWYWDEGSKLPPFLVNVGADAKGIVRVGIGATLPVVRIKEYDGWWYGPIEYPQLPQGQEETNEHK